MTDRELLELAAKAAGEWPSPEPFEHVMNRWNPLTDDGDALRLAVKLGMVIDVRYTDPMALRFNELCFWHPGRGAEPCKRLAFDDIETEPRAATRRAIVRAAAEIGRAQSMRNDVCENCAFAGPRSGFDNHECRRHAPTVVHDPNKHYGVYPEAFVPRWPLMRAKDWCGDFRAAEIGRAM